MVNKDINVGEKQVSVRLLQAEDFPRLKQKFPGIDLCAQDLQAHEQGDITVAVAWIGPAAVGIGMVSWNGPRNAGIARAIPDCPELHRLYVDEASRGQGVAAKIILKLEQFAREREYNQMGLGVGLINDGARGLYTRLGYRPSGLPEYVDEGELGGRCIFLVHLFCKRKEKASGIESS